MVDIIVRVHELALSKNAKQSDDSTPAASFE
jgi:hypothetical protein